MPNTTENLGKSMQVFGNGLVNLAVFPALHWVETKQPQVNQFKEALAKGNLRYFSGRAAVGLFFVGSLTRITGRAINALYDEHSDISDDNNNTTTKSAK